MVQFVCLCVCDVPYHCAFGISNSYFNCSASYPFKKKLCATTLIKPRFLGTRNTSQWVTLLPLRTYTRICNHTPYAWLSSLPSIPTLKPRVPTSRYSFEGTLVIISTWRRSYDPSTITHMNNLCFFCFLRVPKLTIRHHLCFKEILGRTNVSKHENNTFQD